MKKKPKANCWEILLTLLAISGGMAAVDSTGLVDISLWVILAPLWIPLALFILIVVAMLITMVVGMTRDMTRKRGDGDDQGRD